MKDFTKILYRIMLFTINWMRSVKKQTYNKSNVVLQELPYCIEFITVLLVLWKSFHQKINNS